MGEGIDRSKLLQAAAGMDPGLPAAMAANEQLETKRFTTTFESKGWPGLNGEVVIRYPTLGDAVNIESISQGGGPYAHLFATLLVCCEKAPASWYELRPGKTVPELALGNLKDSEGLFDLWDDFLIWRSSFRSPRLPPELQPA